VQKKTSIVNVLEHYNQYHANVSVKVRLNALAGAADN
jgi:hypothetical protein